jgi:hypothetical protein
MGREIAISRGGVDGESDRNSVIGALTLSSVQLRDPVGYCSDIETYARSVLEAAKPNRRTTGSDG